MFRGMIFRVELNTDSHFKAVFLESRRVDSYCYLGRVLTFFVVK